MYRGRNSAVHFPSMKVPPKRKGNARARVAREVFPHAPSMKVPPKRKGNFWRLARAVALIDSLNESPSEKEGKYHRGISRKSGLSPLNESPSEKEGKWWGTPGTDEIPVYPQ